MTKRLAAAATVMMLGMSPALASTLYTSEASYLAAIGGTADISENFNAFTQDQSFRNTTLDVGPFSLSSSGEAQNRGTQNQIDVSPFSFNDFGDLNGSPFAHIFLSNDFGGTTATITFDTAITGFGAMFRELSANTVLVLETSTGTETIEQDIGRSSAFFGFVLEQGQTATSITFQLTDIPEQEDGFGFDDVLLAHVSPIAVVPLPAGLPLMLAGLGALGLVRRRARR